jgi:hypothetical protein
VWLLHLVGDAHQPVHAVSRFTHTQPSGDAGGNPVALTCPRRARRCARSLHTYWDDLPGPGHRAAVALQRSRRLPPADVRTGIDDPAVWVQEDVRLAQEVAYAGPIGDGGGPFSIEPTRHAHARWQGSSWSWQEAAWHA